MSAPVPAPKAFPARPVPRLRAAAAAVVLLALSGCGGHPAPAEGPGAASAPRGWRPARPDTTGPVLAIVGFQPVTRHQVDSLLATAPQGIQQQYRSSPQEYRKVVDRLVDDQVLHQAALRDGIERDSLYQRDLAARTFELQVKHFYRRQSERIPAPTDSQVAAFYDSLTTELDVAGRVRVRHILFKTQEQAKAARRRLQKGTPWDTLCVRESRDGLSKQNGGVIGYVSTDSDLVPGIGKSPAIAAAAFALKEGEASQPLKSEKGWHLIMADDAHPAYRRSLAEVRTQLAADLTTRQKQAFAETFMDSLRRYAGVTVFEDSIAIALRPAYTPQQLFEQAQASAIPGDRIALYRELVRKYPNERVSEQAAFMVGFTYAEELADYASARAAFEEFIRTHPQSDLVQSARWMLENMEKANPPFEGESPGQEAPEGSGQ